VDQIAEGMLDRLKALRDKCEYVPTFECRTCQGTGFLPAIAKRNGRKADGAVPCPLCDKGKAVAAGWWAKSEARRFKPKAAPVETVDLYGEAAEVKS